MNTDGVIQRRIVEIVAEAVAAERERCANIAFYFPVHEYAHNDQGRLAFRQAIGDAIIARRTQ